MGTESPTSNAQSVFLHSHVQTNEFLNPSTLCLETSERRRKRRRRRTTTTTTKCSMFCAKGYWLLNSVFFSADSLFFTHLTWEARLLQQIPWSVFNVLLLLLFLQTPSLKKKKKKSSPDTPPTHSPLPSAVAIIHSTLHSRVLSLTPAEQLRNRLLWLLEMETRPLESNRLFDNTRQPSQRQQQQGNTVAWQGNGGIRKGEII